MIDEEVKQYLDLFISKYKSKTKYRCKEDIKEALRKFLYKKCKIISIDFRIWKYREWLKYVYEGLGVNELMEEQKHTKEEILDLLNCDLKYYRKKSIYGLTYVLIERNHSDEWIIKFSSNLILKLNNDYRISRFNMKLILELMYILELEEMQGHERD